jgi:polysaccharide export outer membrane protein
MIRVWGLIVVWALLQSTPAAAQPGTTPSASAIEYVLGSGDRLSMSVFGQPDLTVTVEVDPQGGVTLPLIGPVTAAGRTVKELTEDVRARLDHDFLVNPRVNFEVVNYRPFFILGEVNRPGSYAFVSGLDVRRAVATAGGYTRRANKSEFSVARTVQGRRTETTLTEDDPVQPGDTITVGRRWF